MTGEGEFFSEGKLYKGMCCIQHLGEFQNDKRNGKGTQTWPNR